MTWDNSRRKAWKVYGVVERQQRAGLFAQRLRELLCLRNMFQESELHTHRDKHILLGCSSESN
jgi:hypothetical protein